MTKNKEVIEKARKKAAHLQKLRQDERYLKVVGKLKREGLLDAHDVPAYRGQVFLQDALWVAELEPRVLELLPAIIARRPSLFTFLELPQDLAMVVRELKRGRAETPYHGISPKQYEQWFSFVGRRMARLRVMRSFRMFADDLKLLERLSQENGNSQSKVLSEALRLYSEYRKPK